ncbi:SdrD B-like domain-containing protein [Flocculibacter collagenilyticus]|uniref:SdrD B-like domain-containing protein n=1 Tax=Flocculibacter collagenilyticus TaxID=2744479 RepID=UPI0018F432AD|nr:SdrD B-like domain-containing protein [Flocculibacter collagenilyticus]
MKQIKRLNWLNNFSLFGFLFKGRISLSSVCKRRLVSQVSLVVCLFVFTGKPAVSFADEPPSALRQIQLNQCEVYDEYWMIVDFSLNKNIILENYDVLHINKQFLLPVGALFSSLGVKFTIEDKQSIDFSLNEQGYNILFNSSSVKNITEEGKVACWATDGIETYISAATLAELLPVQINPKFDQLKIELNTDQSVFPYQQEQERIARQRKLAGALNMSNGDAGWLIEDEYHLFTFPQTEFELRSNYASNRNDKLISSYYLNSRFDLLNHAASVTLNDGTNKDRVSRVSFSRYRTHPNKYIFNHFTEYNVGDISNTSNSLFLNNNTGLGVRLLRNKNNTIQDLAAFSIEGEATAGWEVELYRNGQLLDFTTVQANGRYIFNNVEKYFGANKYIIKLYGRYGEERTEVRNIVIGNDMMPEGEWQFSGSFYNPDYAVLEGKLADSEGYSDDLSYQSSVDYAFSERFNLGAAVNSHSINGEREDYLSTSIRTSIENVFLEGVLTKQVDKGTAINFNALSNIGDHYVNVTGLFADNFESQNVTTLEDEVYFDINAVLSGFLGDSRQQYSTFVNYLDNGQDTISELGVKFSNQFGLINVTNSLSYFNVEQQGESDQYFSGSLKVAGKVKDTRISSILNYSNQHDFDVTSAELIMSNRLNQQVYQSGNISYRPDEDAKWQLGYNLSWINDSIILNGQANIDSNEEYTINVGIKFYLGYDYQDNSLILASKLKPTSSSIDMITYLDKNANLRMDNFDKPLSNIKFYPYKHWNRFATNERGRVVLPGVPTQREAKIIVDGSENDELHITPYVKEVSVFTHAGGMNRIVLPFYNATEAEGTLVVQRNDNIVGLPNITVQLKNMRNELVAETITDSEGYFAFGKLIPSRYRIQFVNNNSNQFERQLNRLSHRFIASEQGGFVDLGEYVLEGDAIQFKRVKYNSLPKEPSPEKSTPNKKNIQDSSIVSTNQQSKNSQQTYWGVQMAAYTQKGLAESEPETFAGLDKHVLEVSNRTSTLYKVVYGKLNSEQQIRSIFSKNKEQINERGGFVHKYDTSE